LRLRASLQPKRYGIGSVLAGHHKQLTRLRFGNQSPRLHGSEFGLVYVAWFFLPEDLRGAHGAAHAAVVRFRSATFACRYTVMLEED
jgi:hypothetical protein